MHGVISLKSSLCLTPTEFPETKQLSVWKSKEIHSIFVHILSQSRVDGKVQVPSSYGKIYWPINGNPYPKLES